MKAMPLKQAQERLYSVAQRKRDTSLTLLTWKQDRSVEVECIEGTIVLREHGYRESELTFTQAHDMKHALKDACAREFPRSNRVHVLERGAAYGKERGAAYGKS